MVFDGSRSFPRESVFNANLFRDPVLTTPSLKTTPIVKNEKNSKKALSNQFSQTVKAPSTISAQQASHSKMSQTTRPRSQNREISQTVVAGPSRQISQKIKRPHSQISRTMVTPSRHTVRSSTEAAKPEESEPFTYQPPRKFDLVEILSTNYSKLMDMAQENAPIERKAYKPKQPQKLNVMSSQKYRPRWHYIKQGSEVGQSSRSVPSEFPSRNEVEPSVQQYDTNQTGSASEEYFAVPENQELSTEFHEDEFSPAYGNGSYNNQSQINGSQHLDQIEYEDYEYGDDFENIEDYEYYDEHGNPISEYFSNVIDPYTGQTSYISRAPSRVSEYRETTPIDPNCICNKCEAENTIWDYITAVLIPRHEYILAMLLIAITAVAIFLLYYIHQFTTYFWKSSCRKHKYLF